MNGCPRILLYSSIVVVLMAYITFQLGIFGRDEFRYYENLWWPDGLRKQRASKEDVAAPPMYAILAMTATKDIGGNIGRLLDDVKGPLMSNITTQNAMAMAAKEYGAPEGATALLVGLYFDNPTAVNEPRWGIGCALSVSNYQELQQFRDQVAVALNDTSIKSVRAVRIGPGPVLKSRVPWRNNFTPMIMAMLQWQRGFETYIEGQKEGLPYSANNGRDTSKQEDMDEVACEIYVMDANEKGAYIDYIVLMGDTSMVWEDCFPSTTSDKRTDTSNTGDSKEQEAKVE